MNTFAPVEQVLRSAAPHALLDVVTTALAARYGARAVGLRLADHLMRSLQAVEGVPGATVPVPLYGSPQGRAFGSQEPYATEAGDADVEVHLPVTIRGDRLGVLTVLMGSGSYTEEARAELLHLCEALGHEVLVAERDTDLYVLARRAARLTLAAELQWQLLPGCSCTRSEFSLGAHLEPAYAIFGDNYDWSACADHLTLTVTNGMGEGIEAALLTNLAVNALRNARRAGLGLVGQASLADQAVYAQYQGRAHVSVLLLRFDLHTGEVEALDAGSPRLLRLRGRAVDTVSFDAQQPLGRFEGTVYETERFSVRSGDRLLFGSDGVYDVPSPAGERYGDRALARSLVANSLLPPSQVPDAVLRELAGHHGDEPLDDDALVVCLDWYGRSGRG
ncbi:PP2C family protein-serine/threonine phosphatase [Streptomyces sp. NPDC059176]|uniref:PP2C family protein-serine/threonine phosphatase n=1 Tax=Streptomyces sp. NPDC059176 TaxID=3346758 RepID=UPI0036AB27A4